MEVYYCLPKSPRSVLAQQEKTFPTQSFMVIECWCFCYLEHMPSQVSLVVISILSSREGGNKV